jgi:hypothetical protein
MAYDIYTAEAGSYTLTFRVAAVSANRSFAVKLDGVVVFQSVALPTTGFYQKWDVATTPSFNIPAGTHTLVIETNASNTNFNYFTVNAVQGN